MLQEVTVVVGFGGSHAGEGADVVDLGRALCDSFIDALPVAGVSISVVTEAGSHSIVAASDGLAAALEAWQFDAGVGPHWEALRIERPAFLYDTTAAAPQDSWLDAMVDTVPSGAGALFAFPLHLGAAVVGVADLYARAPVDGWSSGTIDLARDVALGVSAAAVRLATRSADADSGSTGRNAVELRREVHQAAGMVMSQLDCSASAALLRLRGYSFASGVPLDTLAREVVARRVDFATL